MSSSGWRAVVAAIALVIPAVSACGGDAHRSTATPAATGSALGPIPRRGGLAEATVTLSSAAGSIPVPRSFFGVSTEYWGINHFGRFMRDYVRVMSLLRVPGNGPFTLRIGGDSADESVLDLAVRRLPTSIFDVGAPWFHRVSTLVSALRARVILDLNLVTDTPAGAGRWARAAMTGLPPGSLANYEIGNEPDLYTRRYWESVYSPLGLLLRNLPVELNPPTYVRLFGSYSRVLSRVSPDVGLAGPVVAYPALALNWISTLLRGPHPGLRLVTAHEYPYSGCVPRGSALYPTIDRILGEGASAGLAAAVKPAVLLAHRAGFPFRLTEMNSVTCGGLFGVSNTFATALWAPDALFEVMRTGANGVNVHVRAYAVNGAFGLGPDGIVPHPLLYGLILFTRMLGPDARLVDAHLSAPASLHLKAWAVRVGRNELRVLLINKGRYPVRALLRLPASGPARIERLLAPTVRATSGETLGGRHLGIDDTWVGPPATEEVGRSAQGYELMVPPASAALVRTKTRF